MGLVGVWLFMNILNEEQKIEVGVAISSQKEFEIEVGWWYMKNRNLF